MISCRKPRLRAAKRFFQQPRTLLAPNCQATRTTYLGFRSPIYRHDQQQRRSLASLSYSYAEGPTEPPLVSGTLSSYFTNEIINRHSTRPALISRSEKPRIHGGPITLSKNLGVDRHLAWDFEEFDRHIEGLAKGLVGLGVRKGDRVGVVMGNNRWALNILPDGQACVRSFRDLEADEVACCVKVLMLCYNGRVQELVRFLLL